jgi:hypothetical protein
MATHRSLRTYAEQSNDRRRQIDDSNLSPGTFATCSTHGGVDALVFDITHHKLQRHELQWCTMSLLKIPFILVSAIGVHVSLNSPPRLPESEVKIASVFSESFVRWFVGLRGLQLMKVCCSYGLAFCVLNTADWNMGGIVR